MVRPEKSAGDIRKSFLEFFGSRGHKIVPSSSLVPQDDPTLLFTSAGMVPFKAYFLGFKSDLTRAASCQKCFRTTDIERVGLTLRHMTFFEMLGNFSFGDYFKEEAIAWAWEFLTREIGLPQERLYPTVFQDDDEALRLWEKLGTRHEPRRMGEETNFWAMGATGPCGPCSEIYWDLGPSYGCGKPDCGPGCDCDRYLEIWNLVFTQFDRRADGGLDPLPRRNIDTGMGLERIAFAASGAASPFETDLFRPIVDEIKAIIERRAGREAMERSQPPGRAEPLHVIADHARAAVMLIAEGLIPTNTERGYALRRLIRRAVNYGHLYGPLGPFLHELVAPVVEVYRDVDPELGAAAAKIRDTIRAEEQKFIETLDVGKRELERLLEKSRGTLRGEDAFKLYDTFGFPLEMTREIAQERGVRVDEEGFKRAAEEAARAARSSWRGGSIPSASALFKDVARLESLFTGYESLSGKTRVVACARMDEDWIVALERTPFYPEGGGQIGDQGELWAADGREKLGDVLDTQKEGAAILHRARLLPGKTLKPGAEVTASVDASRRGRIRPHHTATHLLNEALRRVLGAHVRQAGSYVGPEKLRFDFTHPRALSREELLKVEEMVAGEVRKAEPVWTREEEMAQARSLGALALIGENYGERPRLVLIGRKGWEDARERFSLELCGGTHVANTSEIGKFRIVKESSAASGIRRIEAVAGRAAEEYEAERAQEESRGLESLRARERALLDEMASLGGGAEPLGSKAGAADLRRREKELREILSRLKEKAVSERAESAKSIATMGGIPVLAERLEDADPRSLRGASDRMRAELGTGAIFLAAGKNDRLSFVLALTEDLSRKGYDAAKIAKALAGRRGGSAGGRSDFAQGGFADGPWQEILAQLGESIKL